MSPEAITALLERAEATCAEGHLAAAEAMLRKALSVDPTNARALNDLAVVRHRQGAVDEAERYLLQAIVLGGAGPSTLVNLAALAREAGRLVDATHYLEKASAALGQTPQIMLEMASLSEALGDAATARTIRLELRAAMEQGDPVHLARYTLDRDAGRCALLVTEQAMILLASVATPVIEPALLRGVRALMAASGLAPDTLILLPAPGGGSVNVEAALAAVRAALPALAQSLAPATLTVRPLDGDALGDGALIVDAEAGGARTPLLGPGAWIEAHGRALDPIRAPIPLAGAIGGGVIPCPIPVAPDPEAILPIHRLELAVPVFALGPMMLVGLPFDGGASWAARLARASTWYRGVIVLDRANGDLSQTLGGDGTIAPGADASPPPDALPGDDTLYQHLHRPLVENAAVLVGG